jgi:hypothetical protein
MASKRRVEGSSHFARVAPAAHAAHIPEHWSLVDRWRAGSSEFRRERGEDDGLGPVPESTFEALADRQARHVLRQLEKLDVDPEVAAKIAAIDPDGSYAMILTVRGYNGGQRAKDVAWAGRGRALWEKIAYVAGGDDVELIDVDFVELQAFRPDYQGAFPVWGKQSVITADGLRFEGLGSFARWRDSRKVGGRPKKRRGRLTYEQGKKAARAQSSADARARASKARLDDLRARAKKLEASGARDLARPLRAAAKKLDKRIRAGRGKGKKR